MTEPFRVTEEMIQDAVPSSIIDAVLFSEPRKLTPLEQAEWRVRIATLDVEEAETMLSIAELSLEAARKELAELQ